MFGGRPWHLPEPESAEQPIAAGAATGTVAASPLARRPGRPLPLYQLGPFAPGIVASRDDTRDYGPMRAAAHLVLAALVAASFAPAQSGAFDARRLGRVRELVEQHVEDGRLAGAQYLILHGDQVVARHACGVRDVDSGARMEHDTIVRIYSMTKMVTAVAALQLVERGVLGLDDPIARWVPELERPLVLVGGSADAPELAPAERPITVRMLLNHTAGLSYEFQSGSPVGELYRRADLWSAASLDQFLERLGALPLAHQPGRRWHYSVADDVLGALIQRASGTRFEDFVARNIAEPLRMADTFFDVPEDRLPRLAALHTRKDGGLVTTAPTFGAFAEPGRGFAAGGAGLFSTIDDYARFARALKNGGALDGVRILGRKTFELASSPSLTVDQGRVAAGDLWNLICAVRTDLAASGELGSAGMMYWSGAATTHFFVDPQEDVVALLFCQHFPFDEHRLFPRFRTAVYQALN
jgi:CubicO group peptidase (beta-lactamase class C family)